MIGLSKLVGWFCFGLVLLLSPSAGAITQPTTMTQIPVVTPGGAACTDKNVEICLDQAEGDPGFIDAAADALVAPETFQPTCKLTFVPIVKGGMIFNAFGWYNVRMDPLNPGSFIKPPVAQMYGMFAANGFQTGAMLAGQSAVLDLKAEQAAGRYAGGAIGFFVVSGAGVESIDPTTHQLRGPGGAVPTPQFMFFTQHALNSANPGSVAGATYYNVLTWQGVRDPNTFYFGWEDLPIAQGSDSDFDDFVFSVSGVQCGGGGEACDTGKIGPCQAGVMQCRKGALTCVQSVVESTESCNAVDDDCNGQVDDGNLCAPKEVCDRGRCVVSCGTGEFRCATGTTCTPRGLCVEPACAAIECPAGEVCQGGSCVEACTGVVCPHGRSCRNGGCVDLCQGMTCDPGFTCFNGVCESCACSDCVDGMVCHQNQCIEPGCESQTCAAGTHCQAGQCRDNCDGAVCPSGQLCSNGDCVGPATPVGGSGGVAGDSNPPIILGNGGGGTGPGGGNAPGDTPGNGPGGEPAPDPGCACRHVPAPGAPVLSAVLLGLFGLARRRRSSAELARHRLSL